MPGSDADDAETVALCLRIVANGGKSQGGDVIGGGQGFQPVHGTRCDSFAHSFGAVVMHVPAGDGLPAFDGAGAQTDADVRVRQGAVQGVVQPARPPAVLEDGGGEQGQAQAARGVDGVGKVSGRDEGRVGRDLAAARQAAFAAKADEGAVAVYFTLDEEAVGAFFPALMVTFARCLQVIGGSLVQAPFCGGIALAVNLDMGAGFDW